MDFLRKIFGDKFKRKPDRDILMARKEVERVRAKEETLNVDVFITNLDPYDEDFPRED